MNTYGQTACPKCGAINRMYRPLDMLKRMENFNKVSCWDCKHEYKHTDKINNVKTEKDTIKEEGRY